ncbi:hypothetical protein [Streptomyces sp. YGL11-2]|uniref:hypothetical protein n=1 Tax=Streptomyces sp. YGL11-2 TaxID=3414028 RepID=UPI003CE8AAE0
MLRCTRRGWFGLPEDGSGAENGGGRYEEVAGWCLALRETVGSAVPMKSWVRYRILRPDVRQGLGHRRSPNETTTS